MLDLSKMFLVSMSLVTDPDNPTGDDPDATVIDGERLDPDDVSVEDDSTDDDLDDTFEDNDTPEGDSDDIEEGDGNFKSRYGQSVRWGQQQKERADQLEKRIANLRARGVDLDEIEALLPREEPVYQRQPNPDVQEFASKRELANMAQNIQWSLTRTAFLTDNPEFRDKDLGDMLETQAQNIIRNDIRQNGVITLAPDKVYRNASRKVKGMIKNLENRGKKKANQTRQKVKSQSSDLGGDTGKRSGKVKEEEETFDPRKAYVGFSKL